MERIENMPYSKEEKQLTINYEEETKTWEAWTNIKRFMNMFQRRGWEMYDEEYEGTNMISAFFKSNGKSNVRLKDLTKIKKELENE